MSTTVKEYSVTKYFYFIGTIAAFGGFLFGFDVAIVSGAVPFIQSYFGWNELELGWSVSSLLVGCTLGAISTGYFANRFGRKKSLIFVALFFAISTLGTGLAKESFVFIAYRILGGLTVGAISVLVPMYLAEISPAHIRGRMTSTYQLAIITGILVSYVINYQLKDWENNWRWMFASGVFPSILFFVGLFIIPESPRWLYMKGRVEDARKVFLRVAGIKGADSEMTELVKGSTKDNVSLGLSSLINRQYRFVIWIGLFLAIFVQITGCNAVIDYAPKIMMSAGITIDSALLYSILCGVVNFVFTVISIFLVDRVGRRIMYLFGSISMAISLLALSASFFFELNAVFVLCFILLYMASFSACIGPVFWTLVSEIFPNKIRAEAVSFISFVQWAANFLVVCFFPYFLSAAGGAITFLFFAITCLIQFMVAKIYIPETKGKSLEEMESIFSK